ncbi:MAG: helix-turn-helix domain-containing protein [Armatimonadota bacterium]
MTDIMSAQELAEYLGLSYRTVLELAKKGELPGTRFGNTWRFHRAVIERMLGHGEGEPSAPADSK